MRRRLRNALSLLLAAIAAALPMAGCGGKASQHADAGRQRSGAAQLSGTAPGTTSGSGESKAPTSSQFAASAERICRHFNAEIVAIEPKSSSRREIERVVPRRVKLERAALVALEKLMPPSSLAEYWMDMLGARHALADELDELLAAAKKDDKVAIAKLAASKQLAHAALSSAANGGGIEACGHVGGAKPAAKS